MRITGWAVSGTLGYALLVAPAHAMDPSQVFEKVSPSVWVVHSYEGKDRSSSLGSAVVIGMGQLVTNCHVIEKAKVVLLRRQNVMYEAKLEHADPARDLCLLRVANFTAPAVVQRSVNDLRVGERVYAIGNPQGLEVTLSEGLISGLRVWSEKAEPGVNTVVQTSAPISPGSSGGGLFDAQGRLIGITTFGFRDAQNLNVALPTDWIAMVPERAQAAAAKRESSRTANLGTRATNAAPGLPAPGTSYAYSFVERIFSRRPLELTVRVMNVDDTLVEEAVTAPGARILRRVVNAREPSFLEFPLSSSAAFIELAPYLVAVGGGEAPTITSAPDGYPLGASGMPGWNVKVRLHDWEDVVVPAGRFRALRIEANGQRTSPISSQAVIVSKFDVTVWYAPDVKRYVRMEHRTYWANAFEQRLLEHQVLELLKYVPPS